MHTSLSIFRLMPGLAILAFFACQQAQPAQQSPAEAASRAEAREDSLELIAAYARQAQIKAFVIPDVETDAVAAGVALDAADDPALWLHPQNPEKSLIFGSNKQGGIVAYDLTGKEKAYYEVGKINNIEVMYGFALGEKKIDLLGGSNRSDLSVDLFKITENGELQDIAADALQMDSASIDDVYGFCFYQNPQTHDSYLFVNGKNGRVQQHQLIATDSGKIRLQLVREIQFDSQTEGMVADARYGLLYVGEEDRGVWKLSADPEGGVAKSLVALTDTANANISYDVEGLTIYQEADSGYLMVSSQGNFSYAVFERTGENAYLGSFKIMGNEHIDGVEETDGIEAISAPLGDRFPKGVFLAQDGFNFEGDSARAQNFKLVDWRKIEDIFKK